MGAKVFGWSPAEGRSKLDPKREPYWHRIESGSYSSLFAKIEQGDGTWIARWRSPDKKQHYHSLKHQADFDTAVRAARQWFTRVRAEALK